jgi:putative spermidine/putrescine transport system permease protein
MQRPTQLPVINVVAIVLIVVSVVPVYIAQRISGGEAAGARV